MFFQNKGVPLHQETTIKLYTIMTQVEFEKRVEMKISSKEYDAIEVVYMNSDLDKDEFCKMWKKMNKTRIEAYKEMEKEQEFISKVLDIKGRFLFVEDWQMLAINFLTMKAVEILKEFGIEMEGENSWGIPYFKTCSSLSYELDKKLEAIAL